MVIIEPFLTLDESKTAARRLLDFVERKKAIRRVICLRHAATGGIDTAGFWENAPLNGEISVNQILGRVVVPKAHEKADLYVKQYAERLRMLNRQKLPLRLTDGMDPAMTRIIEEERKKQSKDVEVGVYGQNRFTETVSIFKPLIRVENDVAMYCDPASLSNCEHIYFCGDSISVHMSVRDLIEAGVYPSRISVLEDILFTPPYFHGAAGINVIRSL